MIRFIFSAVIFVTLLILSSNLQSPPPQALEAKSLLGITSGADIQGQPLTRSPNDPQPRYIGGPKGFTPTEILVKFQDGAEGDEIKGLGVATGTSILSKNEVTQVYTLNIPSGKTASALVQEYQAHPRVEWAEPNGIYRIFQGPRTPVTPNDTYYAPLQKWYYDVIKASDAWGITTGSSSIVIAIVDSGVMCDHPDLAANMWKNPVDGTYGRDFVGSENGAEPGTDQPGDNDPCVKKGDPSDGDGLDNDGDGVPDAGVSHGTSVAGDAAAVTNNGAGVAGACWSCKIMAVRVMNPEGWGRMGDIADGITYAAQNGARIINLSLGSDERSITLELAVNAAHDQFGAVVVAAAGNENVPTVSYPAKLASTIAVGASAKTNPQGRASFTNWGAEIDVVAPGVIIASTAIVSVADAPSAGMTAGTAAYMTSSGTSDAAPLVSGVVGLMLSRNPSLTNEQVRSILKSTAQTLPDDPSDSPNAGPNWAGSGMVNAFAALSAITLATPTPTPAASATATPTAVTSATPTPTATFTPTAVATATSTATPTRTPTPAGSPTPTPVGTPIITPTPLAAGSPPAPLGPADGASLTGLGTTLTWNNPIGITQYQIQVIPANNDGPAINLIRNAANTYEVLAPVFGVGNYVMLPGMSYTWRVRSTTATVGIDENSPLWGAWSPVRTFRTPPPTSATLSPVFPLDKGSVTTSTVAIQWANSAKDIFYYEIQVSTDVNFGELGPLASVWQNLMHGGVGSLPNSWLTPPLEPGRNYFWRVRPRVQGDGTPVAWSPTWSFAVPAVSPAADYRIAFVSGRDGNYEIYLMNPDGSGQTNLTNHPGDDGYPYPAWSPEGKKIAFATTRDGNWEIYVMNPDGTGQTNLTNNPFEDRPPAWSPDGKKIAFVSNRDGNEEIYVMNSDGTGQTRLTNSPSGDSSPAWSPDGKKIAFRSLRDDNEEIYVMNADGSGQTNLTNNPAIDDFPAWSADSSRIAFVRKGSDPRFANVWLMNADGTEQRQLTSFTHFSMITPPRGEPNSKFVFSGKPSGEGAEIYMIDVKSSAVTNVTNDPGWDYNPVLSPDGGRIVFSSNRSAGNNYDIYVMNLDGSGQTNLTNNPALDDFPAWSPVPLPTTASTSR